MNKINFHGLLLILFIWLFFTTMTFLGCSSSSSSDSGAGSNSSSAGSLDTSFGSGGKVTTRHGTGFAYAKAYSVDSQADGKIVVAGYVRTEGSPNNFIVVRYNTDGSLDSTFGTNGEATTPIGSDSIAHAVAIQADQKIIAIGTAKIGFTNDFAVARYSADGSLDPTFGSGGIVTTSVGSGNYDWDDDRAYAVVVQADGKIVVTRDMRLSIYPTRSRTCSPTRSLLSAMKLTARLIQHLVPVVL